MKIPFPFMIWLWPLPVMEWLADRFVRRVRAKRAEIRADTREMLFAAEMMLAKNCWICGGIGWFGDGSDRLQCNRCGGLGVVNRLTGMALRSS